VINKARVAQWRAEYSSRRYLREAHNEVVKRRWEILLTNIWMAPGDGVPLPVEDPWRTTLLERLSHAAEELARRSSVRDLPDTLEALVQAASATYTPVDALKGRPLPSSPYLVRFSKGNHIADALERGRFRIAPAASYSDSSLNAAQKDDELSHFVVTPDKALKIKLYGYTADATPEEKASPRSLPVVTKELFEYSNTGNFYVLCLTDRYDARMFHDFDADAAIVITNPRLFLKRIGKAMKRLAPGCSLGHKPVRYYDPYIDQRVDLKPPFSKNFSFAYQKEYRLAWQPRRERHLDPIFVEIGSMKDIAFVVSAGP
jgi:hypothetical protein